MTQSSTGRRGMRVAVGCYGRFHAFNLAEQLHRHGCLDSLITGYPWFKARQHISLPRDRVRTLPFVTAACLAGARLPARLAFGLHQESGRNRLWDKTLAGHIPPSIDILNTYAGMSRRTIAAAHVQGVLTVLERGSSHRRVHMQLLAEEHARYGLPFQHDEAVMEDELEEYATTDLIAIPSGFVQRTFLEEGIPEAKLLQVPYGVDLHRFRPEPRRDHRFRVVFIGGFWLRKGVPYLLEAWRRLALTDGELVFIGTTDESLVTRLGYRGLAGVRYAGPIPNADLRHHISEGDVLVLPSIEDGFGLVMAQAMACGVPVIHSHNTGGADIVRHGVDGFEVPIRDALALADRIQQLHDDRPLARHLGANALERVRTLGGWDDYGRRTIAGYRRLLEGAGS
jgi:glycosyltransferase involved in cell wall biosynthesis